MHKLHSLTGSTVDTTFPNRKFRFSPHITLVSKSVIWSTVLRIRALLKKWLRYQNGSHRYPVSTLIKRFTVASPFSGSRRLPVRKR